MMVLRGSLDIEIPLEKLALAHSMLVTWCANVAGRSGVVNLRDADDVPKYHTVCVLIHFVGL